MKDKWLCLTRRYEGLNLHLYTCPTGHLTIGYGHNLENGISPRAALFLLQEDMQNAQNAVHKACPWWGQLNEVRQFVLTDMCFNMGLTKLLTFKKFLAAARQGDYTAAAGEMLNSRWAVQVGYRARELAEMMQTGEYK